MKYDNFNFLFEEGTDSNNPKEIVKGQAEKEGKEEKKDENKKPEEGKTEAESGKTEAVKPDKEKDSSSPQESEVEQAQKEKLAELKAKAEKDPENKALKDQIANAEKLLGVEKEKDPDEEELSDDEKKQRELEKATADKFRQWVKSQGKKLFKGFLTSIVKEAFSNLKIAGFSNPFGNMIDALAAKIDNSAEKNLKTLKDAKKIKGLLVNETFRKACNAAAGKELKDDFFKKITKTYDEYIQKLQKAQMMTFKTEGNSEKFEDWKKHKIAGFQARVDILTAWQKIIQQTIKGG